VFISYNSNLDSDEHDASRFLRGALGAHTKVAYAAGMPEQTTETGVNSGRRGYK
jgi:hypothetical protein